MTHRLRTLIIVAALACGLPWLSAQVIDSTLTFLFADRGGMVATTFGEQPLQDGYAAIEPGLATTPAGVALIRLVADETVVSETGVPAIAPALAGRTVVEIGPEVNTGIAIANPNGFRVTVAIRFTNVLGVDFGSRSLLLNPNTRIAKFVNQDPFSLNAAQPQTATLSFTASAPVAVTAVRGRVNARGEFLMSALPVTPDTGSSPGSQPLVIPHFAEGGGWATEIVLYNMTDQAISGTIEFMGSGSPTAAGLPIPINTTAGQGSAVQYLIQARSWFRVATSGTPSETVAGWVRVTPAAGSIVPAGFAIYSHQRDGVTVTEAVARPEPLTTAMRTYVELREDEDDSGQTVELALGALALANPSAAVATATVRLFDLDGDDTQQSATIPIPANGQISGFITEIVPGAADLELPFRGIARITTGSSPISAISLRARYNARGDFLVTTLPVTDETRPAPTGSAYFPQLVHGGGYATQFVLFSGVSGQNASGTLRFLNPAGAPLPLPIQLLDSN